MAEMFNLCPVRMDGGTMIIALSDPTNVSVLEEVRFLLNQDDGKRGWDRVKGEGVSFMFTTAQDIDRVAARIKRSRTPAQLGMSGGSSARIMSQPVASSVRRFAYSAFA